MTLSLFLCSYCSRKWPENFENNTDYICKDCQQRANQSIPIDPIYSPSTSIDNSAANTRLGKNKGAVFGLEVQMDGSSSTQQPSEQVPLVNDSTNFAQPLISSPGLEARMTLSSGVLKKVGAETIIAGQYFHFHLHNYKFASSALMFLFFGCCCLDFSS